MFSRDYALSGAYRKVVVRPRNVDWNIAVYDDLTTPLFVTDLEKISGKGRIEQDGNCVIRLQHLYHKLVIMLVAMLKLMRNRDERF